MENYLLEINLISAQGLKPPSTNLRRMQTYAIAWIDPSSKLRTRVDRIGGENPTWNDKFIFRVTAAFLSKETSAVTIEIYSTGTFKDPLVGTVRFLIGNCFSPQICSPASSQIGFGVPCFSAIQIRRPSGRFQGVLNIGSMVLNASDTTFLSGISAVGYQDLMGESTRQLKKPKSRRKKDEFTDENYCENSSCGEVSDADSSCSSTTTNTNSTNTNNSSTVLKEWNGRKELVGIGNKERFDAPGLLCGLGFQRKDSSESVRSEIAD